MTIKEAIRFHKSVYKIPDFNDSLLQHIKLSKTQKIKELSVGQKVIFHLSLVLSIKPKILLIDEVIHSMDAYLRKLFLNQLISKLTEYNPTIILVNLNFHDIEHLVNRVILLKNGEIIFDEMIDCLKDKVLINDYIIIA